MTFYSKYLHDYMIAIFFWNLFEQIQYSYRYLVIKNDAICDLMEIIKCASLRVEYIHIYLPNRHNFLIALSNVICSIIILLLWNIELRKDWVSIGSNLLDYLCVDQCIRYIFN